MFILTTYCSSFRKDVKHTAPAVSQFIIWKLHSDIIFFKCQLMFYEKEKCLFYETFSWFNLCLFPSLFLLCLCPSCQLESNILSSCQPPARVRHICYKMLTSTQSRPNTGLLWAIDLSDEKQSPILH